MTLTRHVIVWSLRALLAWGAFELGATIYDRAIEQIAALEALKGHQAAMGRYDERALAASTEPANSDVAALHSIWRLPRDEEAARLLREALIEAGAQAPVIDMAATPLATGARSQVRLDARWREPDVSSPAALARLVATLPHLRVRRLALARGDDGFVAVDAEFEALVQTGEE